MYSRDQLKQILFLDIETASVVPDFDALPAAMQELWKRKSDLLQARVDEELTPAEMYPKRAAIFAEFGKVVCISCGYLKYESDVPQLKLKSFSGPDEKQLLTEFAATLNQFTKANINLLCAHNGKEFDFPYLGRRYLINNLPLPGVIAKIQSAKPWETGMIDTMQLWKFGDYKSYTSLELLCAVLGVPSPKDDIDGSEVGRVFWEEQDYARIARYCEQDVRATAQVLLRMCGEAMIPEEGIL